MCEATGSLPNPGGVLQQRHSHMVKLHAIFSAKEQYKEDQLEAVTRGPKR